MQNDLWCHSKDKGGMGPSKNGSEEAPTHLSTQADSHTSSGRAIRLDARGSMRALVGERSSNNGSYNMRARPRPEKITR